MKVFSVTDLSLNMFLSTYKGKKIRPQADQIEKDRKDSGGSKWEKVIPRQFLKWKSLVPSWKYSTVVSTYFQSEPEVHQHGNGLHCSSHSTLLTKPWFLNCTCFVN